MTTIEEWNAVQLLEPEISFSISSSVEVGEQADGDLQNETVVEFTNRAEEAFTGPGADRKADELAADAAAAMETAGYGETDTDWELQAACRTSTNSAEIFFSEELSDIVAAKRICAECPVIAPCLEGAITRAEPCGVWGGQLFSNGRVLAQKRRRGRPPKVARPEDQLPVVPIPDHLQKLIA